MADDGRAALVARWLELTRATLPGMAAQQGWPIERDHCFMRVFLDHAAGGRWDLAFERPAIRMMPVPVLARAVRTAEEVVASPGLLAPLNEASLAYRRAQRRVRARGAAG